MNILVTGSHGYIGSSFINAYKDTYVFSTFSLQKNRLQDIHLNNINVVLHCAALVHQKNAIDDEEYYEINTTYPLELAKKAQKYGVKQFIFLSSVAVYGENKEYLTEKTSCDPVSSYAKSKLKAEQLLQELNDENFIVSIIRPPMVYGYNAPGNIVSLIQLIQRVRLLPFAKINNRRSFLYIGNLISLINTIVVQQKAGIFLASDDTALSTTELIKFIATNLNRKMYLLNVPLFENCLKLLKPSLYKKLYGNLEIDNTITLERLKYQNPYQTKEGIKLMIKRGG